MRLARTREPWLPSEADEWLLRAAVQRTDRAVDAWRRWRRAIPLDDAHYEAANLLPLVYRNLTRLGVEDRELGRLKGTYRYTWSRNQLILTGGAEAIRTLRAAGIETMVLKGAALSVLYYRDFGARPMTDVDLLVSRERTFDAITTLRDGSFRPHDAYPDPERRVSVHHSTSFVGPSDQELDLHWYSLFQSSPEDDLWEAADPIEIAGERTRTPCPADQLVLLCGHGAQWEQSGSLRWIADSLTLIREAATALDWDRLSEQTIRRRLTPTMLDALEYLRKSFGADIPAETLEELRRDRIRPVEAAARRAARRPDNPGRILISQWDRYRRLKRLDPTAPRQPSFPAQLKTAWGSPSYRAFTLHAARRLLRIGR